MEYCRSISCEKGMLAERVLNTCKKLTDLRHAKINPDNIPQKIRDAKAFKEFVTNYLPELARIIYG